NGHDLDEPTNGSVSHDHPTNGFALDDAQEPAEPEVAPSPQLVADEPLYVHVPARAAAGSAMLGSFRRAWSRLLPGRQDSGAEARELPGVEPAIEPERIANRFARSRNGI